MVCKVVTPKFVLDLNWSFCVNKLVQPKRDHQNDTFLHLQIVNGRRKQATYVSPPLTGAAAESANQSRSWNLYTNSVEKGRRLFGMPSCKLHSIEKNTTSKKCDPPNFHSPDDISFSSGRAGTVCLVSDVINIERDLCIWKILLFQVYSMLHCWTVSICTVLHHI